MNDTYDAVADAAVGRLCGAVSDRVSAAADLYPTTRVADAAWAAAEGHEVHSYADAESLAERLVEAAVGALPPLRRPARTEWARIVARALDRADLRVLVERDE